MLEANDLVYTLPCGRDLVSNINLKVESGMMLGMLGPNGAGKTTLMKMMNGDLAPSGGTVSLDGTRLDKISSEERAKRVAVLPQAASVSFPYPVFDVAMFGRFPHRRSSSLKLDRDVVMECLKKVEADHLAKQAYPTLSGGEQQRVQLARVLAQLEDGRDLLTGKVLLLDEPTSALDLAHQHRVLTIAREVASRGAAVLSILHDLNLASQYADRLIVLHGGKCVKCGQVCDVLTPSVIEHVYQVRAKIHRDPVHGFPFVSTTAGKEEKQVS